MKAKKCKFVASRKQIQRMGFIVSFMKQHPNVTIDKLVNALCGTCYGKRPERDLSCSKKTVYRALNTLAKEYGCPVSYDYGKHIYVLEDPLWDFVTPSLISESELLALVIGGKFSKDILPPSIAQRVTNAVNEVLRSNGSEFLSSGRLESLKILSGAVAMVSDDIFQTVFEAWRQRKVLHIVYEDKSQATTERDIEPQALVFYEMKWSVKAFCRVKQEPRTFHISRIIKAEMLNRNFKVDRKIVASVTLDNFLCYTKTPDVRIHLTKAGIQFAKTHVLHTKQKYHPQEDGSCILEIPAAAEETLIPWILEQRGNAVPLSPQSVIDRVKCEVKNLADTLGV